MSTAGNSRVVNTDDVRLVVGLFDRVAYPSFEKIKEDRMKRIRDFFWKHFFIGSNFRDLRNRVRVLEYQHKFLTAHSNKQMRWKWNRMLTNPKSPFFIGNEN